MKIISLFLAAALMLGLLAGCGNTPAPETTPPATTAPATTAAPETTAPQLPDLETLYNQGMEVLSSQMGEDAPILFPETDVNYLNNFYQGLADVELKQLYAGVAPVTNAPLRSSWWRWPTRPMCRPFWISSRPGWTGSATIPPILRMPKHG